MWNITTWPWSVCECLSLLCYVLLPFMWSWRYDSSTHNKVACCHQVRPMKTSVKLNLDLFISLGVAYSCYTLHAIPKTEPVIFLSIAVLQWQEAKPYINVRPRIPWPGLVWTQSAKGHNHSYLSTVVKVLNFNYREYISRTSRQIQLTQRYWKSGSYQLSENQFDLDWLNQPNQCMTTKKRLLN